MPQCAVSTCRNSHRKTKGRSVRYHRFPAEESVRERWVAVCGRSTIFNTTTARVCSLHFSAPSYERDVEHELLGLPPRSRLRRGAVPDLFVPVVVPSLIKQFNSNPPPPRGRNAAHGGANKNYAVKGGKMGKQNRKRIVGSLLPGMTPPGLHSPLHQLQEEANNHHEVLLALGLVPRNNNFWPDPIESAYLSGNIMPVMEGATSQPPPPTTPPKKSRSRNVSIDDVSPQQNGIRDSEDAASESEGICRAAALSLVSAVIDEPLDLHGENNTTVKEEHNEPTTSSGGGTDDEEETRTRQTTTSGVKRRAVSDINAAAENLSKRSRRDFDDFDEEDDRERMIRGIVENACGDPDEAARLAESLRNEINMLRTYADAKEREWNQVIRMKSLKEEMLMRLERKRAVLSISDHKRGNIRQRPILPKPLLNGAPNSVIGEGRQGPILDVRSIIADYRSRHPEAVPRRGRRLKTGGHSSPAPGELSELGSLLSEALNRPNTDNSRPSSADSSRSGVPLAESSISFKDVLVKFAKMSQSDQQQLQQQQQQQQQQSHLQTSSRLPYPEVTLHPVSPSPSLGPASSLLQGILSKPGSTPPASSPRATNFSPTLARLLTAPERPPTTTPQSTLPVQAPAVSITDLLGPSKNRTEITITPVAPQTSSKQRGKTNAKQENERNDEEEKEEGTDRLVIDEAEKKNATSSASTKQNDDEEEEEEVPECQGCHRSQAQFVCAGCGNQWYCSRECQVDAWDVHSEVCSG